jgi:hypothetical protein
MFWKFQAGILVKFPHMADMGSGGRFPEELFVTHFP